MKKARLPANPAMFEAFQAAQIRPGASPKHKRFVAKLVNVMKRHQESVQRVEAARARRKAEAKHEGA